MKRILIKSSIASTSYKIITSKGDIIFLKKIKLSYIKDLEKKAKKEVREKMLALISPNLIKVLNIRFQRDFISITTQYVNGIALDNYFNLKKYGKIISPDLKKFLAYGIISGILDLHSNGLIHGDLKPSNIIISNEDNIPMLMDYYFNYIKIPSKKNFFKKVFTTHYKYHILSSKIFLPPKSFLNINVKKGIDYYALGLVLFELFTNKYPSMFKTAVSETQLIKWKLSPDHDEYFINNLEKARLPIEYINTILTLILNYNKRINLKKIREIWV
ncbi:protein kinase [bacterium]|nr:protein kinase [bacterium]